MPNVHNIITAHNRTVNPTETTFEIQNISVVEVKSEISRIKTSKATGHDRISPKLLKDSVEVVAESDPSQIFSINPLKKAYFLMTLRLHACLLYT